MSIHKRAKAQFWLAVIIVTMFAVSAVTVGAVGYVAVHFIIKFW